MTSERRTAIDLGPLLAGLEQPLQLVGDQQTREQLIAYVNAAKPHVERAAFDILSQAVNAFNDSNPDQGARLEYADGSIHVRVEATPEGRLETSFDDSDLERVTLRLPKELKELIDMTAGQDGISANNWYVRALSRTIARSVRDSVRDGERGRGRGGRRGYYRGRGNSLRGVVGGDEE